MARVVTLEEMERHWSYRDLMDVHDALDVQEAIDAEIERVRYGKG